MTDKIKEKIPTPFITNFIAECWGKIGDLNNQISSLNNSTESKAVKSIIQNLIDTYLITIGNLESFLDKFTSGKEIDISLINDPTLNSDNKNLKEDVSLNISIDVDKNNKKDTLTNSIDDESIEILKSNIDSFEDDWCLDWNNYEPKKEIIDIGPTPAEIEAAKREFKNSPSIVSIPKSVPSEENLDYAIIDDFPAPTSNPLTNEEIENLMGIPKDIN